MNSTSPKPTGPGEQATPERQAEVPCEARTVTKEEIAELLQKASDHPLGIDFLRTGYLETVATTFGVHAFVVEEARRRLGD